MLIGTGVKSMSLKSKLNYSLLEENNCTSPQVEFSAKHGNENFRILLETLELFVTRDHSSRLTCVLVDI